MAVECVSDVDADIGAKVNANARCHKEETNRPLVHGQIHALVQVTTTTTTIGVEGKEIHVDHLHSADGMRALIIMLMRMQAV